MLPADGLGAPVPAPPGASPAASRLAAALDRIAEALVRRAEADAAARDRFEHAPPGSGAAEALDADTLEELRHRIDAAILLVRATLDEA